MKFLCVKIIVYLIVVKPFFPQGVKFDPQTGSTLHIEVARSNSRRKDRPGI